MIFKGENIKKRLDKILSWYSRYSSNYFLTYFNYSQTFSYMNIWNKILSYLFAFYPRQMLENHSKLSSRFLLPFSLKVLKFWSSLFSNEIRNCIYNYDYKFCSKQMRIKIPNIIQPFFKIFPREKLAVHLVNTHLYLIWCQNRVLAKFGNDHIWEELYSFS